MRWLLITSYRNLVLGLNTDIIRKACSLFLPRFTQRNFTFPIVHRNNSSVLGSHRDLIKSAFAKCLSIRGNFGLNCYIFPKRNIFHTALPADFKMAVWPHSLSLLCLACNEYVLWFQTTDWQANHVILGEGWNISIMMCQLLQSPQQPPPFGRNMTSAANILSAYTSDILGLFSLKGTIPLTSMTVKIKWDKRIVKDLSNVNISFAVSAV